MQTDPRAAVPARARLLISIALTCAVCLVFAAATAADASAAGQYTIYTCKTRGAGSPLGSSPLRAFKPTRPFAIATRGMLSAKNSYRCSAGRGVRGLVSINFWQRGGTAKKGARSQFSLRAPAGAQIKSLAWAGGSSRRDCRWALQVYTRTAGGRYNAVRNEPANRNCPRGGRASKSGFQNLRTVPGSAGATKFVQRVVCVGRRGNPRCSNRAPAYVNTTAARFTVSDSTRPAVALEAKQVYSTGAWTNSLPSVAYSATDNVGIRNAAPVVDGVAQRATARRCDFRGQNGLVPCPNGSGTLPAPSASDGTHRIEVQAVDSAGNGVKSRSSTFRVDRTAPGAAGVAVATSQRWRNENSHTIGWFNPAEGDRAPIVGATYRLCPASGRGCVERKATGANLNALTGLSVPGPGDWTLQLWRRDAAGNEQPANASQPVHLRFDPSPPKLVFDPQQPSDPTRLSVAASDSVSGVAGGQLEISRRGSGSWRQLATTSAAGHLTADVDDSRLPAGEYQVRAFARDQAGNQASSMVGRGGKPVILRLPLRNVTRLSAGVFRKAVEKRRVGKRRHRRVVRRRVERLASRAKIRMGKSFAIGGRLEGSGRHGVPGAAIEVFARSRGGTERLVRRARTDSRGRYRARVRASSSARLRVTYAGTARALPATRRVVVSVPATSSIRATPRRTTNGRSTTFRGRLRKPQRGKLVELQVRLSGRWQTFRTLRSDARGRWHTRYRFRRTCGLTRFAFRARIPEESIYPYASGATGVSRVTVRGRPCT